MKRIWLRRCGLAAGLALIGAGCRSRVPEDAVATWKSGFIGRAEARRYFASLDTRGLRPGSKVDEGSGVTELLSDLAFLKIAAAEAEDPPPEEPVLHLDARASMLVRYYVDRKGKRTHEVTDEEALAVYKEKLAERFTEPVSYTFRHVFFRADRHSEEELARLTRTVLERRARGSSLAGLAAEYSESESARREGIVGPVYGGRMDPRFEEQLERLRPGQPGVIRMPQGTHVVEVFVRRPSRVVPFEEVKTQIVHSIMDRRNEGERKQLLAKLRERYGVLDRTSDPAVGTDEVVLRVKGREMTRGQLDAYLARRGARAWSAASGHKIRRRWVDELVDSNLLYLEAADSGLDREKAFVDRWELRQLTLRANETMNRWFDAEAKRVDQEAVLRYFRDNQGRFSVKQRWQASYLFLPFGGAAPFELAQRLEALGRLAAAPDADPAEVQRRAEESGAVFVDMGWATSLDAARIAPEFQRRLVAQTSPGNTGVFRDEEGLFFVVVRAYEAGRPMTDPADRDSIRARYVELRRAEIRREIKDRELKEREFRVLSTSVFESPDAKS